MQPALVAIWLSVVLGAALGVGQRFAPRVTEPIRTFAVVAAALVVSLSLLPHALECEGLGGLLGALLGYLAIPALERLGMAFFRRMDPRALRLELGYAGLLLHRFGDGVTMSVEGHGYGVLWALGAHEVPIVALVTLAFAPRGLSVALIRATALGISSSLGYFLVSALPPASWHALHGWADAAAAGVLLHIVAHEGLRKHAHHPHSLEAALEAPPSLPQRALDLGAGLLACGLIATLSLDHESGAPELLGHLLQLALLVSPWLCVALVLRVALLRFASVAVPAWWQPARSLRLAPLSGVLDPAALGASFALLGAHFAAAHAVLSLALTLLLLWLSWSAQRASLAAPAPLPLAGATSFGTALEREVVQVAGWVLLGFLAAAYARAYVPPLVDGGSMLARLAWTLVVAGLASGSAPAAVPLAAALVALGLPPVAALSGLLLGACAPLLLRRMRSLSLPAPTACIAACVLLLLACTGAAAPQTALLVPAPAEAAAASDASWLSLAALLAFVLRHIWQRGVRAWLVTALGSPLWRHAGHGQEHVSPGHG